ncbi:MAG: flavocytochrome c [Erysipelotrichaceae bacterium]|nr:flavocytochrome c [Erysipelotrichaceae bacterium]MDY5251593.1 flavocytochrome c [Erysipelotrichaceae bacterium]
MSICLILSLSSCSSNNNASSEISKAEKTEATENDLTTDVVVVGGGGAGIASAISASQNGADVILIEKMGYLGGATMFSGGIIPAVGTSQQQEANIQDDNDWFARDILRPSNYSVRKDLVYKVVEESKPLIEWIESMGVHFDLITNSLYYGQSNYRMHLAEGGGSQMTSTMIDYLESIDNITILTSTAGTGLLTNEAGEVIGVSANDGEKDFNIYANNTVLATSGFAANKDMLEEYIPEMVDAYPLVAPGATGEGIIWGMELGADVANMKAYQGHAFYNEESGQTIAQAIANNGGIFVNKNGVRFTNEYNGYSELSPHVLAQPGKYAYLVFDQNIADNTSQFEGYVEAGIVTSGNTAEELAANLGIDEVAMKDTFDRYVNSIAKGEDEFNRTKLPASWEGPFYAIRVTGDLRHTQGGLVTDTDAHVLREDGSVIQGLYAAGGVTEGFASTGGAAYMSGDGLLQAFVFGRIAGKNAATEEKGNIQATVWKDPNVKETIVIENADESKVDSANLTYKDGTYEGVGQGHGGDIKASVTVSNGKVVEIEIISQNETETIYVSAVDKIINSIIENNGTANVDTVSGATESSNGIMDAVNDALGNAK